MTSVLKVLTYIITSITACPIRLCSASDNVCLNLHNCCYSIYIGGCDVIFMTLNTNKKITSVLKFSTDMITSITTCPIRLCSASDNIRLDLHNCRYSIYNVV